MIKKKTKILTRNNSKRKTQKLSNRPKIISIHRKKKAKTLKFGGAIPIDELLPIISAQLSSVIYSNHYHILFIINQISANLMNYNIDSNIPEGSIYKKNGSDYENFNKKLKELPELDFHPITSLGENIDFLDIYINPIDILNNKLILLSINILDKKYLFIVSKGTNNSTNMLYDLNIKKTKGQKIKTISAEQQQLDKTFIESLFAEPISTNETNIPMQPISIKIDASPDIKYHKGFYKYYEDIMYYIHNKLTGIGENLSSYEKIIFSGHSLGAAIISITAINMYNVLKQYLGEEVNTKVLIHTFGCPKYIKSNSYHHIETKLTENNMYPKENFINYINSRDLVTYAPPSFKRYGVKKEFSGKDVKIPEYIKKNKVFKRLFGLLHHGYYLGILIGGILILQEKFFNPSIIQYTKGDEVKLIKYSHDNNRTQSPTSLSSSNHLPISETAFGGNNQ
jgi:hypothetical protein